MGTARSAMRLSSLMAASQGLRSRVWPARCSMARLWLASRFPALEEISNSCSACATSRGMPQPLRCIRPAGWADEMWARWDGMVGDGKLLYDTKGAIWD